LRIIVATAIKQRRPIVILLDNQRYFYTVVSEEATISPVVREKEGSVATIAVGDIHGNLTLLDDLGSGGCAGRHRGVPGRLHRSRPKHEGLH
jgi:hypothetical protein